MRVQLPDGKVAQFPDSMGPAEIEAVLSQQFPSGSTSTITGQPVPTGEEKISQSNEAIRAMAPIVGDVVMTAAAPQLKGLGVGVKAINAIIRGMGAAAGGGLGDIVGQTATSEKPVDMQSAGKQAIAGAAGEIGGSAVLGGLKFAGQKIGKPLINLATEFTPVGERLAAKATRVGNTARKEFEQKTTKRAIDFIDGMKVVGDKEKSGLEIGSVLSGKKDFKEVYKDYNKLIDSAAGPEDELLMDDLTQKIGDLVSEQMERQGDQRV